MRDRQRGRHRSGVWQGNLMRDRQRGRHRSGVWPGNPQRAEHLHVPCHGDVQPALQPSEARAGRWRRR
eukprot:scaffold130306_cov30-Tisochrysis_lutea.AAC.2